MKQVFSFQESNNPASSSPSYPQRPTGINKTINQLLTKFNLAWIRKTLELRLAEAQEDNLSYSEFLEILLTDEKENREDNRRKRLYQEAKFPFEKTIDDFDFTFQPSIKKGEILELAT